MIKFKLGKIKKYYNFYKLETVSMQYYKEQINNIKISIPVIKILKTPLLQRVFFYYLLARK